MKISEAIRLARKEKCHIKNKRLRPPTYCQDAKSLVHWLFTDGKSKKETKKLLKTWLSSDAWELDYEKF